MLLLKADLHGDNLLNVVDGFCKSHDIPPENARRLAKSVYGGMYAAAITI